MVKIHDRQSWQISSGAALDQCGKQYGVSWEKEPYECLRMKENPTALKTVEVWLSNRTDLE